MDTTNSKLCTHEGCANRLAPGKKYCWKHFKELRTKTVITKQMRTHMQSNCCGVTCVKGKAHEYGDEYCSKCGQGCVWKMVAA